MPIFFPNDVAVWATLQKVEGNALVGVNRCARNLDALCARFSLERLHPGRVSCSRNLKMLPPCLQEMAQSNRLRALLIKVSKQYKH
jgi:hypothetical protein